MASTDSPRAARSDSSFLARLACGTHRYEDMVPFAENAVLAAAALGGESSADERHLLTVAYKHALAPIRAAWRAVSSFEREENALGMEDHAAVLAEYRENLRLELESFCCRVLRFVEPRLADSEPSPEGRVFFLKMKGDYHRYLAEVKGGEERAAHVEETLASYEHAQGIALAELSPINPVWLGLSLNFAVFYYEIICDHGKAISIAQEALDKAMVLVDTLTEDSFKNCIVVMQLLRNNLTLWKSDTYYERLCAWEGRLDQVYKDPKDEVTEAAQKPKTAM